jgi:flagellar hook-associated protein 2
VPGTMSVGGLVSGLKTDEIIAKIMEYARRPQDKLKAEKAEAQAKLAIWQDLNTRVLALKLKADAIADAADFQTAKVTSSDESVLTASAYGSATPGSYYLKVTSRAQSHQVASQSGAYTSLNDVVGVGNVNITLADGTSFTVTLDSNNNTLAGLRDAINKANKGIKASIVNVGTTESPNYRMLLTSADTGLARRMTSVDTSGLTGGTAPVFDLENPVQAASDAVVEIGEGAGKITIARSSNTISDIIPGVNVNIVSADATKTIRINVVSDTSKVKAAIESFVSQYNELVDVIDAQFKYDAKTGTSGALMGDYQLQSVQQDLQSAVSRVVEGLNSQFSALSSIGITLDSSGHLKIDNERLAEALNGNLESVARLFSVGLDSNSAYVSFFTSTADTKSSGRAGWIVEITQNARRAQVTAGSELTGTLDADEVLTINGKYIRLSAGMNIDDVVAEINRYSSDTNVMALKTDATGTGTGNYLTLRSVRYGSAYSFTVVSNRSFAAGVTTGVGNQIVTPADPDGESGLGQGMVGLDVAGKINGETAIGKGQILSLDSAKNAANGLSLSISPNAPLGSVKVVYTKGIGAALRDMLNGMTSSTGIITTAQNGINDRIRELDDAIADWDNRLAEQEARLYEKFNAMESRLAELQRQGNYLLAQFSAMNKSRSS